MESNQSWWSSVTTTWDAQALSTSTPTSANRTAVRIKSAQSSAIQTLPAIPLSPNFTIVATTLSSSYARSEAPSMSLSYHTSSMSALTTSTLAMPNQRPSRLSSSAAMGIGIAAGIIGIITLLSAALFIYRCWKVRRSPAVRYYEQARLWKGFTPATPSTARTTLVESKMANIYFTEIRTPATPAFPLSPPLDAGRLSWPMTPATSRSQLIELPV